MEGTLKKGTDREGYNIMYVDVINIKPINESDEEQYVYPCYYYDDGKCSKVSMYNIEY